MELGLLSILGIGFILGIKHAIEPDHVIAVSTIASQSKKLFKSSLAGVFWGLGHTLTLFIIGMVIILMKGTISDAWAMSLEFLVGMMLVYFGYVAMTSYQKAKRKQGEIINHKGFYLKSMFIGLIHGLAGSAAMVLLTMSTVESLLEGALYILIFGVGTVIGMLVFTTILGIPFVLSQNKLVINRVLTQVTGFISLVFGVYYMYNLGITEGLFKMWMQ
ncbi:sulfite exporter TauE/SafE family protein [Halalkalibacter urbisdiaboli]|uniref:HoxN/HupN/NixA family nickel/cobalt transporter n=1 Tax=Halalkalibacter urbisdiaboli TaxID=1960589 RepID=UPI000B4361C5|nr:sulfite exporter TauE/SafE family protein [Halalkalibacter urbisdiaboli]